MEKELLRVFETGKNNIDIIRDTIDIVKENKGLDKNTRLVIPNKEQIQEVSNNVLAQYDCLTDKIYVYEKNFQKINDRMIRDFITMGLEKEIDNGKKLLIMQLVIHELEHAYQKKLSLDKESNSPYVIISKDNYKIMGIKREIEQLSNEFLEMMMGIKSEFDLICKGIEFQNKLNDLSNKLNINNKFYSENHDLFPVERAAQINSYKTIKNFLKSSDYQNLYHYFSSKKIFSEIKDYKNGMFPLLEYTLGIGNAKLFDKLLPYINELKTLDAKLFYGLEISQEELDIRKDELMKHLSKIR